MINMIERALGRFRRDRGGNIAVMFALTLLPLLALVGCAIDYARINQVRTSLQSAIDLASVSAVTKSSPAAMAANSMTADGPIPAGVADAKSIFAANTAGLTGFTLTSITAIVAKNGGDLISTVDFSADVPTTLLALLGFKSITIDGTSSAVGGVDRSTSTSMCSSIIRRRWVLPRQQPIWPS